TDPQDINLKPLEAISQNDSSDDVAEIINKAANLIGNVLKDESRANYALFRGISKLPNIETMKERFGIRSVCIATYPMYKGLSKLVGMDIVDGGKTIEDEIDALEKHYNNYDYFFFHVKKTDSYGEDGDFDKKVEVIEQFDALLPKIEVLDFDVISITGDHSTPAIMKAHSFHPVPLLIKHPYPRRNPVNDFSETECLKGSLGTIYAKHIINLMLAGADRLKKYGA
ncbi:phosphoglycerate mutase, partial [candidate division WOR-3 bacterium]|nr:phosphoglycerate mutase [candidate division WOR-3 bacterium]